MGGRKDKIMTTRDKLNKWVEKEYRWIDREIRKNIAKDRMSDYADDLIQEIILSLYNMPEERIEGMLENGKLKWYVLSSAGLSLRSKTSPFYNKIRKHKMYSRENGLAGSDSNIFERIDDTGETLIECYYSCMLREIENLHWYNKTLLKEYWIDGETLDTLHAKYKISKLHLTKDLNKGIKTIREKCEECDNPKL